MLKAFLTGISIYTFGCIIYIVTLGHELIQLIELILLGTPGFSAFVAVYLSPRHKIAMGPLLAVCQTLIGQLMAYFYKSFGGHVDNIGDIFTTLLIIFLYNLTLCVIGSIFGLICGKIYKKLD